MMDGALVSTTVLALGGIAGTFFGPFFVARQQARTSTQKELSDQRRLLYIEVLKHAHNLQRNLGLGDVYMQPRIEEVMSIGEVQARLVLLSNEDVQTAWDALQHTNTRFHYWWNEESNHGLNPMEELPDHLAVEIGVVVRSLRFACAESARVQG